MGLFYFPQALAPSSGWTAVSEGSDTGCGIRAGALWCWGYSTPFGTNPPKYAPTQVGSNTDWTTISLGSAHGCGIRTDPSTFVGTLWCFGNDALGELGIGYTSTSYLPLTQVPGTTNWVGVSAGVNSTCAAGKDYSLWCWGDDTNGELGNGTTSASPQSSPVRTWTWNQLAAFGSSTCATRTDGTLWCWGDGTWGQTAQGTFSSAPLEVPAKVGAQTWSGVSASANGYHACAVRSDGTLWCWGYNGWGQLGTGDQNARALPVQVNGSSGWNQVSAGYSHTCGIWNSTLWCWGDNSWGQLGTGGFASSNYTQWISGQQWLAVSAGAYTTCAIRADQTLWCWGYNGTGAVGQGSASPAAIPTPTQVGTAASWTGISVGTFYACAARLDGTLWCWGYNDAGQLGVGDYATRTSPTQVGAWIGPWGKPAAGATTTCAPSALGQLWCWGSNANGIAAQGNTTTTTYPWPTVQPAASPVVGVTGWMSASVGADHACATDGVATCWGANGSGQLGIGSVQPESWPTPVQ